MKRQDLLLLTFLFSQATPVWAMNGDYDSEDKTWTLVGRSAPQSGVDQSGSFASEESSVYPTILAHQPSSEQAQRLERRIHEGIAFTEEMLKDFIGLEKVVVMGESGSGKSTLKTALVKGNLKVNRKYQVVAEEPLLGSEIGHGEESETSFVSIHMGPKNIPICDLPGDGDTRGPATEIQNLAMIHATLSATPVKILLTVPETHLGGRKTPFLKQMDFITKLYPRDDLKKGLAIVITKQGGDKTRENPHKVLKDILDYKSNEEITSNTEKRHYMTEDVRDLLTHLLHEGNIKKRVLFFPSPKKAAETAEEPIPYLPFSKKEAEDNNTETIRKTILDAVEDLKFMKKPNLNIVLPPEAHLLVIKLGEDLNKTIENSLKDIVSPRIVKLCKEQTHAYGREGSLEGLKKNVRTLEMALHLLEDDSDERMKAFASTFDAYFDQDKNTVERYIKTLRFLKTLNSKDVSYSPAAWALPLHSALQQIQGFIDTLANGLCLNVTRFANGLNDTVRNGRTSSAECTDEEAYINELIQKMDNIKQAIAALQSPTSGSMGDFLTPLRGFFSHRNDDYVRTTENSISILEQLNVLKKIYYPKDIWVSIFNSSIEHLQNTIHTHEQIFALNNHLESERHLQQELITTKEEKEAERVALFQQIEEHRQKLEEEKQDQVRAMEQQKQETQRLALVIDEERSRQKELRQEQEKQTADALAREQRLQEQYEEDKRRREEDYKCQVELGEERRAREEAEHALLLQKVKTETQETAGRQQEEIHRLALRMEKERQHQTEILQEQKIIAAAEEKRFQEELRRLAEERERKATEEIARQVEANRQLTIQLEEQHQAQEKLVKQQKESELKAQELLRLAEEKRQLEQEGLRRDLGAQLAEVERKRAAELEAARREAAEKQKKEEAQRKELAATQQREKEAFRKDLEAKVAEVERKRVEEKKVLTNKFAEKDAALGIIKITAEKQNIVFAQQQKIMEARAAQQQKVIEAANQKEHQITQRLAAIEKDLNIKKAKEVQEARAKAAVQQAARKRAAQIEQLLKLPPRTQITKEQYNLLPVNKRYAEQSFKSVRQPGSNIPTRLIFYYRK